MIKQFGLAGAGVLAAALAYNTIGSPEGENPLPLRPLTPWSGQDYGSNDLVSTKEQRMAGAAVRAQDMINALRDFRAVNGIEMDLDVNPSGNPLIGVEDSPITSNFGKRANKFKLAEQVPQLAAFLVEKFAEAGLREGDWVVVTMTGSYISYDVAALAALSECRLNPIIFSCASSSKWGANIPGIDAQTPGLTYPDVERYLWDSGFIQFRSAGCSLGGSRDNGKNVPDPDLLRQAITRSGIPFIPPPVASSPDEARELGIKDRWARVEERLPAGQSIEFVLNCGGGTVAIAGHDGEDIPTGKLISTRTLDRIYDTDERPDSFFIDCVERGIIGLNMRSPKTLPALPPTLPPARGGLEWQA